MTNKIDGRFCFLVFLLGAASVFAFAPFGLYPLIWFVLTIFYALQRRVIDSDLAQRQKIYQATLLGWLFGFGMFIAGVSWIYVSLHTFGGMPAAVAALATVLFCAFMALYPALASAIFALRPTRCGLLGGIYFASLWTLGEWLRGWAFTGFPWLSIGYSQAPPSPMTGFAPLIGVFGLSWLTVFLATLIYELSVRLFPPALLTTQASTGNTGKIENKRSWQMILPAVLMIVLLLGTGKVLQHISWVKPIGETFSVSLLQGNISQDMKWEPEKFEETLRLYYQMIRENPAHLTILPETAFPAFLGEMPPGYMEQLSELAQRHQGDILFGIVLGNRDQYANGAVAIGVSGAQQYYLKSHLVPFGEFVPRGFTWFMSQLSIPMSGFLPGEPDQIPMQFTGQKLAVNICYEDAFGEEIIRSLPEAGILANISNVAWFGDSFAPAQHLQIAQLRALETGRMMLRATNTGMTAIIDTDGSVLGTLEPFTRGVLRGEVRAYQDSTPYVTWGNWPTILFSFLMVVIVLILGFRKNPTGTTQAD